MQRDPFRGDEEAVFVRVQMVGLRSNFTLMMRAASSWSTIFSGRNELRLRLAYDTFGPPATNSVSFVTGSR